MLMQHIDPWADYLNGSPGHMILKSQIPNYLPLLYVLMLPLGVVSLPVAQIIWAVCNLAFAGVSGWLAARFYDIRGRAAVAVVCLLWMATPTRVTIGNGQYGLLVLVLWCAALLTARIDDKRSMIAGVSYVKFNFAPPLFLYLLMKSGMRRGLMSLVPVLAGAALVCGWLNEWHSVGQIFRFLISPERVAETGYFPRWGGSNLMDAVEPIFFRAHEPFNMLTATSTSIALVTWGILLYKCLRRQFDAVDWHMAILGLGSFALFRHHPYDAVVLLFPLCFALRRRQSKLAKVLFGIVAYFWYAQRMMNGSLDWTLFRSRLEFALLVVALVITYRMGPRVQRSSAPELRSSSAPALH